MPSGARPRIRSKSWLFASLDRSALAAAFFRRHRRRSLPLKRHWSSKLDGLGHLSALAAA